MVKPTKEQIDKMNYKKPITSFKDVKKSLAADGKPMYMDGSDVMPTPNVDAIDNRISFIYTELLICIGSRRRAMASQDTYRKRLRESPRTGDKYVKQHNKRNE